MSNKQMVLVLLAAFLLAIVSAYATRGVTP